MNSNTSRRRKEEGMGSMTRSLFLLLSTIALYNSLQRHHHHHLVFECFAFTPIIHVSSRAKTCKNDRCKISSPCIFHHQKPTISIIIRNLAEYGGDNGGDELSSSEMNQNNDVRLDVRNLLTQRSIQTFIYLCESLRGQHSGTWLEEFLETKNQIHYHGTGAGYIERFGGSWEGPILAILEQPKDIVVVSAQRRRGRGREGSRRNNPYVKVQSAEIEIDIDPVSIASRILSVREQIAKEWESDLDLLCEANNRILDSYFQLAKEERTKRDDELGTTPPFVFERSTSNLIKDNTSFVSDASTPFRKGNFDLLYNLCTQVSVHRLLREMKDAGRSKEVSYSWLRDFYMDRVVAYFDGNQNYGRADDFIDDLLRSSPSIIVSTDDGSSSGGGVFADPMALAKDIIDTRSHILQEWKEIMTDVPQDHNGGIRPILLNKQMAAWGQQQSPEGRESPGSFQ